MRRRPVHRLPKPVCADVHKPPHSGQSPSATSTITVRMHEGIPHTHACMHLPARRHATAPTKPARTYAPRHNASSTICPSVFLSAFFNISFSTRL